MIVLVYELPSELVPMVMTPKIVLEADTKLVMVLPSVVRVVYTPSVEIADPEATTLLDSEALEAPEEAPEEALPAPPAVTLLASLTTEVTPRTPVAVAARFEREVAEATIH